MGQLAFRAAESADQIRFRMLVDALSCQVHTTAHTAEPVGHLESTVT